MSQDDYELTEAELRAIYRTRPVPQLPSPADLPRFDEEGERDPFGQDEEMLDAAIQRSFRAAIRLATAAHAGGFCMMLPWPKPGYIDPALRPWRSVVSSQPDHPGALQAEIPPLVVRWGPLEGTTGIQALVQRAALCVAALDRAGPSEVYDILADLLDDLGYVALGRDVHEQKLDYPLMRLIEKPPPNGFFSIGQNAARMHRNDILHGDMHPGNFGYDKTKKSAVVRDLGRSWFAERSLTVEECASDVGLMKLTCSFEQWEAVKLGYRTEAPDLAADVFKLV